MNKLIFDSFDFEITPNAPPTWSASVEYLSFRHGVRVLTVNLPINKINDYVEMVTLDLWVDEATKSNEASMSLNGSLLSCRSIAKLVRPTVVTTCKSYLDVDEDNDDVPDYAEYDVIYAERFEDVVLQLFEGTGWLPRIDCALLEDFPVVTETEPIMVLNGSKLEQLKNLIDLFNPDDLWGQEVVFLCNPFTSEILIVPPRGGSSNVNVLDAVPAKIFDVEVSEVDLTLPEKLYLQEDPSSTFRHITHFDPYKYHLYEYEFETNLHETILEREHYWSYKYDDWERYVDIWASLSGVQELIGNLVITDTTESTIYEAETRILYTEAARKYVVPLVGDPYWDLFNISYKWVTTRASQIKARTEYTYIAGPPYNDPIYYYPCSGYVDPTEETGNEWWNNLPYTDEYYDQLAEQIEPQEATPEYPVDVTIDENGNLICIKWINACFELSLPGTIAQLVRDNGAFIIDKDHMPLYVTSTDGIRIAKKRTVSLEKSGESIHYSTSQEAEFYFYEYPAFEELNVVDVSVTITDEVFTYDDEGNLIGVRSKQVTKTDKNITVLDTYKHYKPITEEIMAVTTYSTQKIYDLEWTLLSTSLTNIDVDTVSGKPSGPSPVSPIQSVENDITSREALYQQKISREVLRLYQDYLTYYTDKLEGVLYVTIDNLTIEEMAEYLDGYFNTVPNMEYTLGFSSQHLDVRGIIGGHLQLIASEDPKRPLSIASDGTVNELHTSGILEAMQVEPFRVNGIAMNWDKEGVYTVALSAIQVI